MSSARKCDICGKFYEEPICNDVIRIHIQYHSYNGDYIDLCDDCYKKLCDFVKPAIVGDYPVERKR